MADKIGELLVEIHYNGTSMLPYHWAKFKYSRSEARDQTLHWVPIPIPMPMPMITHAHGFWVGMGAMLSFMGKRGWAWVRYYCSLVGMGGHRFCASLHPAPNWSQTSWMQGIR